MKNIKEAEAESGINKQNIRYYEKMGLIHPDRNTINGYRKYSEEDIRRLKFIYLFRKTGYAFRRNTKSAGRSN